VVAQSLVQDDRGPDVLEQAAQHRLSDPGEHATPSAEGQNGPAAFITRARQVTALWERSAAARTWRTGLVLLDASDLTPEPRDQGFSSQREKDAFAGARGPVVTGRAAPGVGAGYACPLLLPSGAARGSALKAGLRVYLCQAA
jgi:hypothetical protein